MLSPWLSAPTVWGFTCGPLPPVLCAERVARITKTYHDIDAVTNLLDEVRWRSHLREGWWHPGDTGLGEDWGRDESQLRQTCPLQKERDLELAARIGQSLLKQNRSLTERNELLEEQLELAKEEVTAPGHGSGLWPPVCPPGGCCGPFGRVLKHFCLSRLHSCATRCPCGMTSCTSTPPPRRRASPPPPPPHREWDPLSCRSPGAQLLLWAGQEPSLGWHWPHPCPPLVAVGPTPQSSVAVDAWELGERAGVRVGIPTLPALLRPSLLSPGCAGTSPRCPCSSTSSTTPCSRSSGAWRRRTRSCAWR